MSTFTIASAHVTIRKAQDCRVGSGARRHLVPLPAARWAELRPNPIECVNPKPAAAPTRRPLPARRCARSAARAPADQQDDDWPAGRWYPSEAVIVVRPLMPRNRRPRAQPGRSACNPRRPTSVSYRATCQFSPCRLVDFVDADLGKVDFVETHLGNLHG
jgi:hypothetical protein